MTRQSVAIPAGPRIAPLRPDPSRGKASGVAVGPRPVPHGPRPVPARAGATVAARPATAPRPAADLGPLTGLGVALLLCVGCVCGGLLDLLLVGGPAWALAVLYLAACGYTATRVRAADWFSALVSPPLAFAGAVILLAMLMPNSFGPGLLGVAATTFELLAAKAKALYVGTALSAAVLLVRRFKARRVVR